MGTTVGPFDPRDPKFIMFIPPFDAVLLRHQVLDVGLPSKNAILVLAIRRTVQIRQQFLWRAAGRRQQFLVRHNKLGGFRLLRALY